MLIFRNNILYPISRLSKSTITFEVVLHPLLYYYICQTNCVILGLDRILFSTWSRFRLTFNKNNF